MKRKFRELFRSLYNLFYYFKVIWNDRDWDHAYIEYLQLAKYKKMYNYRQSSKYVMHYVNEEKDNQALRICINILERRRISWYTETWYDKVGELDQSVKIPYLRIMDSVEQRDWKILNRLIEKYGECWWD